MKNALISLVTGAAMVVSPFPVLAAGTAASAPVAKVVSPQKTAGPLAPAGAAGVKQAQGFEDIPLIWLVGAAGVIALGVLAFTGDDDNDATSTSTTGT